VWANRWAEEGFIKFGLNIYWVLVRNEGNTWKKGQNSLRLRKYDWKSLELVIKESDRGLNSAKARN